MTKEGYLYWYSKNTSGNSHGIISFQLTSLFIVPNLGTNYWSTLLRTVKFYHPNRLLLNLPKANSIIRQVPLLIIIIIRLYTHGFEEQICLSTDLDSYPYFCFKLTFLTGTHAKLLKPNLTFATNFLSYSPYYRNLTQLTILIYFTQHLVTQIKITLLLIIFKFIFGFGSPTIIHVSNSLS